MRLLIHGSGFQRPFRSDPEELRCGKPREFRGNPDCQWSPSSLDWAALGRSSGGSTGAANLNELLGVIRVQAVESIDELRIIGHSNGTFLALAGTIQPDNVVFTENSMIGNSLSFVSIRSALRYLQDRLKADARVVLAGCGKRGVVTDLLEFVSYTVLRSVAGFTEPIMYAIDGTTAGPPVRDRQGRQLGRRIDDDARVTVRGKAMYSKAANRIEDVLGSAAVGTGVLQTDAWKLEPDAETHEGDVFRLVKRFRAKPGVISGAELGYKMLKLFSPFRGNVAGIGFAGDFAGLRVVEDKTIKGKMTLDVGKGWADRMTPSTLEQRVREFESAIELTVQRRPGVVPAK